MRTEDSRSGLGQALLCHQLLCDSGPRVSHGNGANKKAHVTVLRQSQCDEFLEDKAPPCCTDLLKRGRELGSRLAASLTYQELNKYLQSEGASASFGTSEGRQKTAEHLTCCPFSWKPTTANMWVWGILGCAGYLSYLKGAGMTLTCGRQCE